jgi:hypothetical protein
MWLPPDPEPVDETAMKPWEPALAAAAEWETLTYIVVDELHEGIAGLVLSPWPRVDARGRPYFGDESRRLRIATPASALRALLSEQRTPVVLVAVEPDQLDALRNRPVAVGDVFAARVTATAPDGAPQDPGEWLVPPILDVTAPARELAKAQTSAALSGTPSEEFLAAAEQEEGA